MKKKVQKLTDTEYRYRTVRPNVAEEKRSREKNKSASSLKAASPSFGSDPRNYRPTAS